jgi:DNA-binding response OmpR family regulator
MSIQLRRYPDFARIGRVKKRILVVEDDGSLLLVLRDTLLFEGFEVQCASNGQTAMKIAAAFDPDLIILDITLPDANGFELCRPLSRNGQSPTIFLTARGQKADRIRGLQLGADDYLTKPFDLEELVARVHAVLRRTRGLVEQISLGSVAIDFRLRQASNAGRTIQLTHREFELLRYLAERHDRIVYRDELLREVWGYPESPITRSVDHAVARLRKKIEPDPHHPLYIHTVHGDGYCLTFSPPKSI